MAEVTDVTVYTAVETTTSEFNLNSSNAATGNDTFTDEMSSKLQYVIWVYLLPVVLLVGIVGNVLSIVVLQSRAFRHTTTGVYLPLTAVADSMFLLTGAMEILEIADVYNARETNVWSCRIYKVTLRSFVMSFLLGAINRLYPMSLNDIPNRSVDPFHNMRKSNYEVVHYSAGDASIWMLVAFTFDRFVAVCFPLSKRRVCRWKRAVVASVTILFLSLVKNLHEFWTRGPVYTRTGELYRICGSQLQYQFFLDYVRPWLVLALVMAVPFVLILVFNCSIVHGLINAKRVRDRAVSVFDATATGTRNRSPSSAISGFRQTTFMCLGISFTFLICIAPSIVLLIGKPYWKHRTNTAYNISKAIANFLVFVNHSVNFFLYCVTGQRFRDELGAMLTCQQQRRGSAAAIPIEPPTPRSFHGVLKLQ